MTGGFNARWDGRGNAVWLSSRGHGRPILTLRVGSVPSENAQYTMRFRHACVGEALQGRFGKGGPITSISYREDRPFRPKLAADENAHGGRLHVQPFDAVAQRERFADFGVRVGLHQVT